MSFVRQEVGNFLKDASFGNSTQLGRIFAAIIVVGRHVFENISMLAHL
jgi:hypothetical protein